MSDHVFRPRERQCQEGQVAPTRTVTEICRVLGDDGPADQEKTVVKI